MPEQVLTEEITFNWLRVGDEYFGPNVVPDPGSDRCMKTADDKAIAVTASGVRKGQEFVVDYLLRVKKIV